MSLVGLFAMIGIAWLFSTNRRRFPLRVAAWGVGLQLFFGLLVLRTASGLWLFRMLNDAVVKLLEFTAKGSEFVFGVYATEHFSFALNVLPTILFFSALMSVLYHLGVMQRVVGAVAWLMQRTMKTSGAESLSTAANIFVGQTEAPLVVRPYVARMTLSELNAVMVGGFATVAGGVLAAYVGMLHAHFPDIAGHLIAASVLSAPAALVIAKVMVPETQLSETAEGATAESLERIDANLVDAVARGATEGLKLALNVGAMLLVFLSLLALMNYLVGLPVMAYDSLMHTHHAAPTIEGILGVLFWPLAFLMGVPIDDCSQVASLLGEKLVLTEFVAYMHLGEALTRGGELSHRAAVIASYALCGFANFGSIGIQIGGISAMAPERRGDLARLGVRAMAGGMLAACMTACVAGLMT
ncbi:MAG: NupC/NupG family nucleoside CNT transporter [Deltaproteobacteria bacterium]|nr:NupC/NupG family nucleoside CNT transporter [Deltaproteobacteria bacterium]